MTIFGRLKDTGKNCYFRLVLKTEYFRGLVPCIGRAFIAVKTLSYRQNYNSQTQFDCVGGVPMVRITNGNRRGNVHK